MVTDDIAELERQFEQLDEAADDAWSAWVQLNDAARRARTNLIRALARRWRSQQPDPAKNKHTEK